jgi:hypothetical protein
MVCADGGLEDCDEMSTIDAMAARRCANVEFDLTDDYGGENAAGNQNVDCPGLDSKLDLIEGLRHEWNGRRTR